MFMLGRVSIATTVVRPGNSAQVETTGTLARKIESHQSSLQSKDDDTSWKAKQSDHKGRQDTNATVAHAAVVLPDSRCAKFGPPSSRAQGFAGMMHEDSVDSGWPSEQSPHDDDHLPVSKTNKMESINANPQKKPLRIAGRRRKALAGVTESLRRRITPPKAKKDGGHAVHVKASKRNDPVAMHVSRSVSDVKEGTPQKDSCNMDEPCPPSIKAKEKQPQTVAIKTNVKPPKRKQVKGGAYPGVPRTCKKQKLEPVRTSTRKAFKVASQKLKTVFDSGDKDDSEDEEEQDKHLSEAKPVSVPASAGLLLLSSKADDQGQEQPKKRTPPPTFDAKDHFRKGRLQEVINVHRSTLKRTTEQMNVESPKSNTPLQMEAQPQQKGTVPLKTQKARLGVAPVSEKQIPVPPLQSVNLEKRAARTIGDMHNLYSNESEEDEEVDEGMMRKRTNTLGTKLHAIAAPAPKEKTPHNPACPKDDDDFTALDALNTAMSKFLENHAKLSDTICEKKYSLLQAEMKHALQAAYANSKLSITKTVQKSEISCTTAIKAFESKVSHMQSYVDQHLATISSMRQECHLLQHKAQDMIESSRLSMEQSHTSEMESIQRSHELIQEKFRSGVESIHHYKKQMTPSFILNKT